MLITILQISIIVTEMYYMKKTVNINITNSIWHTNRINKDLKMITKMYSQKNLKLKKVLVTCSTNKKCLQNGTGYHHNH